MSRFIQPRGRRGSQKWLQVAVENNAPSLTDPIAARLDVPPATIHWLSPLPEDDFSEYRDQAFIDRLGVKLQNRSLAGFWPSLGPQWDGLGRTDRGDLLLVEAKAHIGEMISPPSQAGPASLAIIRAALLETRSHLGAGNDSDWAGTYYQYANRLAHLYLLRVLNQLPAWLVFVHFVGDEDMKGPATREEWEGAIEAMKATLGLFRQHQLDKYVIDAFADVRELDNA